MTALRVRAEVKRFFLDRERVAREVDRKRIRAMARVGAFTRTTAKRSIRSRRGPSRPGKPPSSHTHRLKREIWFSLDPRTRSVVIGPSGFAGARVPEVLEHGGPSRIESKFGPTRTASIQARPFMGPALKITQTKLSQEIARA